MDIAPERTPTRPTPQTYARVVGIAYLAITICGALRVAWTSVAPQGAGSCRMLLFEVPPLRHGQELDGYFLGCFER